MLLIIIRLLADFFDRCILIRDNTTIFMLFSMIFDLIFLKINFIYLKQYLN